MISKIFKISVILILIFTTYSSFAQNAARLRKVNNSLKSTQKEFARTLDDNNVNNKAESILIDFIATERKKLQKTAISSKNLTTTEKILALRAQTKFFDTLQSEINSNTLDVNYVRAYIDGFKDVWGTIFTHQPYTQVMQPYDAKVTGLMSGVFIDYPHAATLRDLKILKEMENDPENITNQMGNNENFALLDSLIFILGNTRPELLINFANNTKHEVLSKAIRQHKSPMIQTILSLGNQKDMIIYLPFVLQLAKNELVRADIDKKRSEPSLYYQILVDAEMSNVAKVKSGETPLYLEPTRYYLKKYAIRFYTDIMNSLHEESESKRFFTLDGLRPQDLYYIITSSEAELYTSSYLYTYKKLIGMFPKGRLDSLFHLVQFDDYKKFLSMAGRYSTLSSFMKQMPGDSSMVIINKMMYGLESNVKNGLEETASVAEIFPGIAADDYLSDLAITEIKSNYSRCINIPNPYGMKVYSTLEDIFYAIKNNDVKDMVDLHPALEVFFTLKHEALRSKSGNVNELVLFYGDEDGKSSYASFLSLFSDESQWSIEKNSNWITIKSIKLYPVVIYANIPLLQAGEDIKAQEALINYLATEHIECQIIIHRGHSYHLPQTLKYVTPSVQLVVLGSCGGYKEIFKLLETNPNIQVVSTKQVGSKLVNEPLLKVLNDQLLNQRDPDWRVLWKQLNTQFKNNKQAFDYFQEYIPPFKNTALLVSTLFAQAGIYQ